jgi:leader peptidase (prepilin peptidase) / N-methyltransferase
MLWLILAICIGALSAGLITGGVFRVHSEWEWMRPKRACIKCEVPRSGLDLLPFIGDARTMQRCRKCRSFLPWQYPLIELIIILMVVFHFWRYMNGIWIPLQATDMLWLWVARDIIFSLFLLVIFVYDLKYSLILDVYTIPAAIIAIIVNAVLGVSVASLVFGIMILFFLFMTQYVFSNGRLLGSGDVRMGILMGAMLGFIDGIAAVFIAYILGSIIGGTWLLLSKIKINDRVPFGTFLAVGAFVMIVWGDILLLWL